MSRHIESSRQPDGDWVATVPAVPGFRVYARTKQETLDLAEMLAAIFTVGRSTNATRILAFYPGNIPEAAHAGGASLAGSPWHSSAS